MTARPNQTLAQTKTIQSNHHQLIKVLTLPLNPPPLLFLLALSRPPLLTPSSFPSDIITIVTSSLHFPR